jgi:putative nucleotidyltransferase with HDIG domain
MNEMSEQTYFRIRISSIIPGRPTTFDVFIFLNQHYVLYLRAGDCLRAEKVAALDANTRALFYVPESQRSLFQSYMTAQMSADDISVREKANILRESSMALVEDMYENPDVAQALKDSKAIIDSFVEFMEKEPEAMAQLISLSSHDFYTYNHSLDVSIYGLGLGQVAGYSGDDLTELGRGALLHDIGKRNVPSEIICKKGGLNDDEWAQMQKHPLYGLKILNEHDVSDAIKACCFEHHENFLGNGYPQQLPGPEIHPMARIVALTDTYDALTTKRSYNTPMMPREALSFMREKLAQRYDPDLLKAMSDVLFRMEKLSA